MIESMALSGNIKVSVVIPHFSSIRSENLKGLIEDLKKQTCKNLEIILVKGISPQGKAINEGARLAKGEYLVILDDDSRIAHERVLANLIRALEKDASIGMAGASILTPENANAFQQKAAKQFPRFNMPVMEAVTDSDLPCHGCVAFPRQVFEKVGMEREDILRGLDPDLRVRIRKAGFRIVLVPDAWAYHPLPESFLKFLRTFIRNGYGSAYLQVNFPEINYQTDEKVQVEGFTPKRSFLFRVLRYPFRLISSLCSLQWIRLAGYTVYVAGYIIGLVQFSLLKFFCSKPLPAAPRRTGSAVKI